MWHIEKRFSQPNAQMKIKMQTADWDVGTEMRPDSSAAAILKLQRVAAVVAVCSQASDNDDRRQSVLKVCAPLIWQLQKRVCAPRCLVFFAIYFLPIVSGNLNLCQKFPSHKNGLRWRTSTFICILPSDFFISSLLLSLFFICKLFYLTAFSGGFF